MKRIIGYAQGVVEYDEKVCLNVSESLVKEILDGIEALVQLKCGVNEVAVLLIKEV